MGEVIADRVKAEGLQGKCPVDHTKAPEPPKTCPVDHTKLVGYSLPTEHPDVPVHTSAAANKEAASPQITTAQYIRAQQAISSMYSESSDAGSAIPSECPMHNASAPHTLVDGDNMMPPPNQRAAYDQPFPLKTERETSSIPRANTGKNWVYPSEQMFWNAMTRKGWNWRNEEEEVSPAAVEQIIKIHNFQNEKGWNEILLWESFHREECDNPQLLRFSGKPKNLSPRARFRHYILRYDKPFDRHDWIVDRCGTQVRYVLDYYDTGMDELGDDSPQAQDPVVIDVRPALDSFSAALDRTKVFFLRRFPSIATKLFEYPMIPVDYNGSSDDS